MSIKKHIVAVSLVVLANAIGSTYVLADHTRGHVNVTVGALSPKAEYGQKVFDQQCASCHGLNGAGTRKGPPLIHDIYNPGHHSNKSFYNAVSRGVRQHHWSYGNMPAQKQLGFSDMAALVQFIREVQKQNGIVTRAHRM